MLHMDITSLSDGKWKDAGVRLPGYDVERIAENTHKTPGWVHFGAGNIFRGFIARISQRMIEDGLCDTGIIAADTFDYEIIDKIYKPFDNLTLMADLHPDGNIGYEIIGSVGEALKADMSDSGSAARLKEIFTAPSLKIVSFTITEKGYALRGIDGKLSPIAAEDAENGPEAPRHAMSVICSLMLSRYNAGGMPVALVSMDNCSRNGQKLMESVVGMAKLWEEKGFVDGGFIDYLTDEKRVSFPWSMIDKITPRPDAGVERRLAQMGIADMAPITTSRGTFIAPFVNAEVPQYLVIEDSFPAGRPPFEKAGVYMTDRDTVNRAERMKVMTCLNPLHTALAVFGCLLGYDHIAKEMRDVHLPELIRRIGYDEGMPVVEDPGIIDPKAFLDEVLTQRLPNEFIPDMPQRIATDTSQKIPVRFGQTICAYIERPDLDPKSLTYIPLVIAGWLRYLLGIDDRGEHMERSSDPMLPELDRMLEGIMFGQPDSCVGKLDAILSNKTLFAADLTACGLSEKITAMFKEMLAGPGAVRAALARYLER